jgi:FixJ family two-component response regulator
MALMATIAVVDDDKFVRDALEDLIASLGHRVRTFQSANEFINSGEFAQLSCVITDLEMPGMSGLDLQQHLLANGNNTPLILLTAFPEERTRSLALSNGAMGFLERPFKEADLTSYLEFALKLTKDRVR